MPAWRNNPQQKIIIFEFLGMVQKLYQARSSLDFLAKDILVGIQGNNLRDNGNEKIIETDASWAVK